MDVVKRIDLCAEYSAKQMDLAYRQNPNKTEGKKDQFAYTAVAMGNQAIIENVDTETYLELRYKQLDRIAETRNETAWTEEIRRLIAIKDLLFTGECNFISDSKEKFVSFQRRSLKDSLPEDRSAEEIEKKELLPV